jgi:hypothetical protein
MTLSIFSLSYGWAAILDLDRIIQAARNGEQESFKQLYYHFWDMVLNYILYMGVPQEDAVELCNDVFVHVYQNFERFESD